jgi:hypothetical protein
VYSYGGEDILQVPNDWWENGLLTEWLCTRKSHSCHSKACSNYTLPTADLTWSAQIFKSDMRSETPATDSSLKLDADGHTHGFPVFNLLIPGDARWNDILSFLRGFLWRLPSIGMLCRVRRFSTVVRNADNVLSDCMASHLTRQQCSRAWWIGRDYRSYRYRLLTSPHVCKVSLKFLSSKTKVLV